MNGERVASYENVTHVLRAWYGGRHGALGEPGNYPFTKAQFVNAPVFPRYAFIAITSFRGSSDSRRTPEGYRWDG